MKETFYCMERGSAERYLKERAAAKAEFPSFEGAPAAEEIYSLEGGEAHIRIEGPLSPEGPDARDRAAGWKGASYKAIQAAMERARNDPSAKSVILDIDSPGGALAGCDETYQACRALAAAKPVEARAGGMLASAAYWLALPAHKITASSPASRIGSIGVLAAAYDYSKFEESIGIKEVVITSSRAPEKHDDLSKEEGKAQVRKQLDALERIFYARVSECRGVSLERIEKNFGRGGLLPALDPDPERNGAVRCGMIDGIEERAAFGRQDNAGFNAPFYGGENNSGQAEGTQEGHCMDLPEFLRTNPAAKAEAERLEKEAFEKGKAQAQAEYAAGVELAMPVLSSAAYPASIKALAADALSGKKSMDAFEAAAAVYDAGREAERSKEAAEETAEQGGVAADAPDLGPQAEKALDAAVQAELGRKKEAGRARQWK